jgi:hypothetical protein
MVATFVDKTLALDELTLSGTVVRSVMVTDVLKCVCRPLLEDQLSEGYTDFRFRAYCTGTSDTCCFVSYHRTISSYSYGYVGGVSSTSISIAPLRQLPNCSSESHGRGKPDDASYRRTTSGCSHRQIRACTIERQRYSRTVSSRGCSNYVRTYRT